jgi:hypothetical protein
MTKRKLTRAEYRKLIRSKTTKVDLLLQDHNDGEGVELTVSSYNSPRIDVVFNLSNRTALDLSEALHELASAWSGPRNSQPKADDPGPEESELTTGGR